MSSLPENDVLSKVELVLPRNVVETCYLLPTGVGTEFLSSNISKATVTRTHVFKAEDESVRIQITVTALRLSNSHYPEYVMIKDIKKKSENNQELSYQHALTLAPASLIDNLNQKKNAKNIADSQPLQIYSSSSLFQDILPDFTSTIQNRVIDSTTVQIFGDHILEGIPTVESISSVEPGVLAHGVVDSDSQDLNTITTTEAEEILAEENHSIIETVIPAELEKPGNIVQSCISTNTAANEVAHDNENIDNDIRKQLTEEENVGLDQIEECIQTRSNYTITARIYFEKCLICRHEVKDLEALREHLLSTHGDDASAKGYIEMVSKKLKVKCEVCREEYPSQQLLHRHMEEKHLQEEELKCDKCGVVLDSKRKLDKHNKQFHQENERFLCHLCPSSFKEHAYLLSHLRHVHTSKKENFNCEKCDKYFTTEKYLYNHNLRVHGQKKYVCSYCDKGFTNAANRDRHIMLVHERGNIKGHSCPFCERFFALKFNMLDHIKTVHRQEFSHNCELCGAGFRRQSEVVTHKKAIHGDSKIKFAKPVKRKPGRPNRSGSRSSLITVASASAGTGESKNSGPKAYIEKDSSQRTPKNPKAIRKIQAVVIKASPEMIKTLGIAPMSITQQ